MKNLAKVNGAKALRKKEQKGIFGGRNGSPRGCCNPANSCCVTQPVASSLINGGCATPASGCLYAYANPNCSDFYGAICI